MIRSNADEFFEIARFPGVVGAVDRTHIRGVVGAGSVSEVCFAVMKASVVKPQQTVQVLLSHNVLIERTFESFRR